MSSFAGLHGAFAVRGIPTVYTAQAYAFTMSSEPKWKRWTYLALESLVASRVSVVGACSLSEGEQARSLPGAHSVAVVPNGIDELSAGGHPLTRDQEPDPRIVAIGRPLPQRRPEACAHILSELRDRAEVRWLGGGSEDSDGARALRAAGIPMSGWLPRSEVLEILADSLVYLHWTAWDGLPLSVLEALALDVIVVASDIGPNREVLGPEQVCRTEREAIELISRILEDPALRSRLRSDQRRRRRVHGADLMTRRWAALYETLVCETGAGA
jgi:glycosyltransferase involved in cell wall biosynthesis